MADIINSLNGANYITVKVTENAVINGNNLLSAYTLAKSTNPNGAAKSASNRLAVILPPATYDLEAQSLTLDTQYIDIIGSTNDRSKHYIKSNIISAGRGVIRQTANDVKIINLTVKIFGGIIPLYNSSDPAAYFPDTNLNNTYIENVEFISASENLIGHSSTDAFSTRGNINYSGTYINCKGYYEFFGSTAIVSGTFKDCIGGAGSFGGISNGTFTNCSGGNGSFGGAGYGTASGTFVNCVGGTNSFGGGPGGISNGTFINCRGGAGSFEPS